MNNTQKIINVFGNKIYINDDRSYLCRKEDKRLRDVIHDLRTLHPNHDVSLKNGKVWHDGLQVDEFDIKNQLF